MGKVEQAFDELRSNQNQFETGGKLCTTCMCYKPPPTKKCHGCRNNQFIPIYCNAGSRVYNFFEMLSSANVWPLSRQMESSAVGFQSKLASFQSHLDHDCKGRDRCPLAHVAKKLEDVVGGVMKETKGLDLRAFQKST